MTLPSEYDNKFWLALLHELDLRGGAASPSDVFPRMRSYFPEITDEDAARLQPSGGNKWMNCIRWVRQYLVQRGCIDKAARGEWRMSKAGRKWLDENWRGPDADYSAVVKPPPAVKRPPNGASKRRRPVAPPGGAAVGEAVAPTNGPTVADLPLKPVALVDPVESICEHLKQSQRQSNAPQQFEQDLTQAFALLGFESHHVGGPGETDIVLEAPLGQASYSVVVDAKTTATGAVADGQINWTAIGEHREARGATYAAVVAGDFGGGRLHRSAERDKVALITTEMVCELLRLQARTPLSLLELRDLFVVHPWIWSAFGRVQATPAAG